MSEDEKKVIQGLVIDPLIFSFQTACKCGGKCCHSGVYTDKSEHERILSKRQDIIKYMDDTQTQDERLWFEDPVEDTDFPSGIAVGTEVFNGKCVFLDKNGLCVIQRMAIDEQKHPWEYKPHYCILFPLTVFEGSLTVDDEHFEKSCNREKPASEAIVDYCTEEILFLYGEAALQEIQEYKKEYFAKSKEAAHE